jgi:hypothetical protein
MHIEAPQPDQSRILTRKIVFFLSNQYYFTLFEFIFCLDESICFFTQKKLYFICNY